MYLKDLNKNYDVIFNLGFNCQGIHYTKLHNLRCGNGPTDWLAVHSLPILNNLIDNKFKGFMDLKDLRIFGAGNGFHYVLNDSTITASYHDFPLQYTVEQSYPTFEAKLNRRIDRFYSKLQNCKSALFIRTSFLDSEVNELPALVDILSKYVNPNASFNVVFIELNPYVTQVIDKGTNIKNTCYLQFPRGTTWEGHAPSWDYFLSNINLVPSN
ncbi:DUF1796 family putative cysteine peptidase [Clostridium pasteurianum]|uniref:Putative papain-like cysteine peptidase (DUF1796) n=1 Tax=Clostridium pasteurianum BC1 TaxID=86416 RepID=R4K436_CLOPA|nr:DUF1796 family putative cysteine peptidase [Clostridium pasteurianum]AGK97902.1 Putative papain-like cysteine peptidase (DUF1796) [Clostridium pasteurianum BC1]